MQQELLTTKQAARVVGMSPAWFEWKRCKGGDQPTFIRVGRAIRYERDDLLAWFHAKAVTPQKGG